MTRWRTSSRFAHALGEVAAEGLELSAVRAERGVDGVRAVGAFLFDERRDGVAERRVAGHHRLRLEHAADDLVGRGRGARAEVGRHVLECRACRRHLGGGIRHRPRRRHGGGGREHGDRSGRQTGAHPDA